MEIINNLIQGEVDWLKARAGKISGTKLGIVMAGVKAQETLMYELIAEKLAPIEETFKTPAMERGNYLETFAIEEYEKLSGLKVEQPGLIIKNDYHICSPDGVIYNKDGIITKALEIKCLAAKKQLKYMTTSNFADVYKIDKSYYWQVVNYFLVIDTLESLDFCLYNPDMYDKKYSIHIIPVTRKELQKDIDKALTKLDTFKKEWDKLKNILIK